MLSVYHDTRFLEVHLTRQCADIGPFALKGLRLVGAWKLTVTDLVERRCGAGSMVVSKTLVCAVRLVS